MINLNYYIEQIVPGHFARREDILEDFRTKLSAMGFFPLPLSRNDIECFWIRLECRDGKSRGVPRELLEDILATSDLMETFKGFFKYEK